MSEEEVVVESTLHCIHISLRGLTCSPLDGQEERESDHVSRVDRRTKLKQSLLDLQEERQEWARQESLPGRL